MASGKRPDPRRRKTSHPHASYLAVKPGEKRGAFLAGELYGCYGHRTHAQQPCVNDITTGELQCPYCASGLIPEWRGYVPLWDVDFQLRYVLIGEEIFDSVDLIKHRAKVVVMRAKNPISPLIVREETLLTRELPNKAPYSEPIAMLKVCLTLWKNDALTKWCESRWPLAMGGTGGEVVKVDRPPAVKPYTAPTDDGAVAPAVDVVMQRLKNKAAHLKPSTNGNGKHE